MQPLQETTNSPAKVTAPRKSSFLGKMMPFGRKSSKESLAVPAAKEVAEEVTPVAPAAPVFYTVVHTFVEGKSADFWAMIGSMKPEDWAAMAKKHESMGFKNHSFMPTSPTGVVNCLWECATETTPEEFQTFIDGEDGPGPGIFTNKCYRVMPGAILPASHFAKDAKEAAAPEPSTGSFFWVFHSFKSAEAAAGFWQWMGSMTPSDMEAMGAKNLSLGMHNHSFAPCGEQGPAICIWESKEPMTAEAFQQFIDGPDGPGAGAVFDNTVHLAMAGAVLPSAKFTKPKPMIETSMFVCPPCKTAPDKAFGPEGQQAMMWLSKLPDGRQASRIYLQKGFDWRQNIQPVLPGCPEWCPATHFGYLESGSMGIKMKDGSERVIKAGETYLVQPVHIPILSEDAVMVEFSQDPTYQQLVDKK